MLLCPEHTQTSPNNMSISDVVTLFDIAVSVDGPRVCLGGSNVDHVPPGSPSGLATDLTVATSVSSMRIVTSSSTLGENPQTLA